MIKNTRKKKRNHGHAMPAGAGIDGGVHDHEWVVFSTALSEGSLMLQCVQCGAMGTVDQPTKEEWNDAFHASTCPHRWRDATRVTIRHATFPEFYVVPKQPGPDCECAECREISDYERVPVEILRRPPTFGDTDRQELETLADFVATTDFCSLLFPAYIKGFQEYTGQKCSPAVREIVKRIDGIHRKGLHCRPAIVARLLREFAKQDSQT